MIGAIIFVVVIALIVFGIWKTKGKPPTGNKFKIGE